MSPANLKGLNMKTVPLCEQIKASQALYRSAAERVNELSDEELARLLAVVDDATLMRALSVVDDDTLKRLLSATDDRVLAHILSISDNDVLARMLAAADDRILVRALRIADDRALARALSVVDDDTLARMLAAADGRTLTRGLSVVDDYTLARVLSVVDDRALTCGLSGVDSFGLKRISRFRSFRVPIVPDLDKRVAEAVEQHGLGAGRYAWAITLAGEAGAALKAAVGPEMAGRLIYEASTGRIAPDPYMPNEEALADIRRCAQL
jgi:hypothetical protein